MGRFAFKFSGLDHCELPSRDRFTDRAGGVDRGFCVLLLRHEGIPTDRHHGNDTLNGKYLPGRPLIGRIH